jgi:hypothetical protein
MAKWWGVSWKRVVVVLVIVFAIVWLIGRATERMEPWIESRRILRDTPGVNAVPIAQPDTTIAQLSGGRVEFFGISMQTPWGGVINANLAPGMAVIPFPEHCATIFLYEHTKDEFERAMFDRAASNRGAGINSTSFGLMSAEMNVTPEELKWWYSRDRNEAASFLLEMKAMKLGGARVIYSIQIGNYRGFQEGDPQRAPYSVRLDLYDASDQHYEIVISSPGGGQAVITQAEVNAMIASIRRAP